MVDHSAGSSALGYLFQCRYALLTALERLKVDIGAEISIEKFDDVTFERDGTPFELIQTKHHVGTAKTLSDASVDLWKTIRVWCDGIEAGIYSSGVNYFIVTTSLASANSAVGKLKRNDRDVEFALEQLTNTAQSSHSQENQPAYQAFLKLSPEKRKQLFDNFYVIDASPDAEKVQEKIRNEIYFAVPAEHHQYFLERLEGWWMNKIIKCLVLTGSALIRVAEIDTKIDELREQFKVDNLPIDFLDELPPDAIDLNVDDRIFIRQLKIISATSKRMEHAIKDYYRAFEQRARWVRENLLVGSELESYETRLIDEWDRHFEKHKERLSANSTDPEKIDIGRNIYNEIQDLSINIRPECNESYVVRGSYQMLADKKQVGWHPEFVDRLRVVLSTGGQKK